MEPLLHIQKINHLNDEITSPISRTVMNNGKGRSLFLNSTQSINTVAVWESEASTAVRGNHYHLHKNEIVYIIKGKVKIYYWLPEKEEIENILVESGDLITIKPGLGHAYQAIDNTLAFEMGSHPYNPADTIHDVRV